eukprot:scaffold1124_cov361-Prasinococcus_capsulatus_cf.AAC.29
MLPVGAELHVRGTSPAAPRPVLHWAYPLARPASGASVLLQALAAAATSLPGCKVSFGEGAFLRRGPASTAESEGRAVFKP